MHRRFAAAVAIAACLLPAALAAADTYKLEIATVAPKKTPWAELLALYEKNVETASGGRIALPGEAQVIGPQPEPAIAIGHRRARRLQHLLAENDLAAAHPHRHARRVADKGRHEG